MAIKKFLLYSTLFLLSFPKIGALASGAKLEFWNRQRKGANGDCADASQEWFQAARRTGIEFVRFSPAGMKSESRDFLLGNADHYTGIPAKDLKLLQEVLDRAEKYGIKVVLTMFSLPGARWRQQNNYEFDYRLWSDEAYHVQAASFWRDLARQLRGHPAVVGYNPLNEPHPERKDGFESGNSESFHRWLAAQEGKAADLDLFYRRIIKAIREVDQTTPIILDTRFHATPEGFRFQMPMDDPAVFYSFHFYDPWEYTTFRVNQGRFQYPDCMPGDREGPTISWKSTELSQRLEPVISWTKRHGVPSRRILAGEFGCDRRVTGAKAYLTDILRLFNAQEWHWAFYSFRSSDWDGMDYELGTKGLGRKYWQDREAGKPHEALIQRRDNPLWDVLKTQFPKL